MICGYKIFFIVWRVVRHFGLSCFAGWLAYWLTSTILSHTTLFQNGVGVFSIHHFSLLVALCFAVVVHILEDYYFKWF